MIASLLLFSHSLENCVLSPINSIMCLDICVVRVEHFIKCPLQFFSGSLNIGVLMNNRFLLECPIPIVIFALMIVLYSRIMDVLNSERDLFYSFPPEASRNLLCVIGILAIKCTCGLFLFFEAVIYLKQ